MVPAYHRGHLLYGEHLVRYRAADQLTSGKRVLDIACGSGYGTALLAQNAKYVFGVDLDASAIEYADKNYAGQNIKFTLGSATKIPLPDASVETVVSFETIEHVEEYQEFLAEIRRVLTPDGLLILSTPNDIAFPESNVFHVHEFVRKELIRELKKQFSHIEEYFQGAWIYSALLRREQLNGQWSESVQTLNEAPLAAEDAPYFLMLCSNARIEEKLVPEAVISEPYSVRKIQEYEKSVRDFIEEQHKVIEHLDAKNKEGMNDAIELRKELIYYQKRFGRVEELLNRFKK